ncbi:MAG: hypothetical protein VX777_03595 [Chlamydiota bacterium]|nr:hypothetical protein [Chlamydiota bacterium]
MKSQTKAYHMPIEQCRTQKLVDDLMITHSWVGPSTKYVWDQKETIKKKIGTVACAAIEITSKVMCRIGLFTPYNVWERLNAYEAYEKKIANTEPPQWEKTLIKTKTKTFNHLHDYALENDLVYYKPRNAGIEEWTPMYVPPGKPVIIDSDGTNFSVEVSRKSNETILFTKKVGTEKRCKLTGKYFCTNLNEKDNWRESWFNIPVISVIFKLPVMNFISCLPSPRRLINNGRYQFMISHCGVKHRYYIDPAEKKHEYFYGVSQVLALELQAETPKLYYADPWLPFKLSYSHNLPLKFVARGGAVSASTVFLIGYEKHNPSKLILYVRMIDFDIKGYNPFYWLLNYYTFNSKSLSKRQMTLPPADWKQVDLPEFDTTARFSKLINIIQNGEGNHARILNIRASKDGIHGFYTKKLRDTKWEFVETPEDLIAESDFLN